MERTLLEEVSQFLFLESELLDSHQFEEWLGLFAADGLYWMPLRHDQADPYEDLSLIHENCALLRMRVDRMQHPTAHGMEMPIWTSRVLGNIRITHATASIVEATARFCLVEAENDRQRLFAGRYHFTLERGDSLKIKRKRVDLVNCDAPFASIQILV